jgi:hypothetical protein
MAQYRIDSDSDRRECTSMRAALKAARQMLRVPRVYRGAEYQHERPGENGEWECCTGVDIWRSRTNARRVMGACADVVITV